MRFENNTSPTDLKMVNPGPITLSSGKTVPPGVVGYAWRAPNNYWQATTAEDTGRRLIRDSSYRVGKGYLSSEDAGVAIIRFVTDGEGLR